MNKCNSIFGQILQLFANSDVDSIDDDLDVKIPAGEIKNELVIIQSCVHVKNEPIDNSEFSVYLVAATELYN